MAIEYPSAGAYYVAMEQHNGEEGVRHILF